MIVLPHIGQLVRAELERQERTPSWLAKKINCSRTNIHKIFLRQSIDTDLLMRISVALQHNFLAQLSEELRRRSQAENDEFSLG